jgi:ABC-2 type transport system permease protein
MRYDLTREWWFFRRDRHAVATVTAALLLAGLAVGMGLRDVELQREAIRILESSTMADLEASLSEQPDAGTAIYYSFRLVYDPPSALAFAARGVRDELPWKHRLRVLALEGQIYENDAGNPELGQAGRIDYAFLVSVIAPLLIILMLHDVVDHEKRQNRYDLLAATAGNARTLIKWRASLRSVALAVALVLPFVMAAFWSGAKISDVLLLITVTLAYLLAWGAAAVWVARRAASAATTATILLGLWMLTVIVVPLAAGAAAERWISVPQGGEILLQQRETVNDAWDLPEEVTMDAFVKSHPEWSDHAGLGDGFDWKWYYAFQQLGDESVADLSEALREGIRSRDDVMGTVAWFTPPLLVDRLFARLARTDIDAFQRYEACVRDYHATLRQAQYPMIFRVDPYDPEYLLQLDVTRACS